MTWRKYVLTFAPDQVDEPITYRLARDWDLMFTILRAGVDEQGGKLIIALEGNDWDISEAIRYLEGVNVQVRELNRFVTKDDIRCTDCGMCLSICPVRAYTMNRTTWKVEFDQDKCIACGLCLDACPPGALKQGRPIS